MSGSTVHLTLPDRHLFKFPPANLPSTLPPPDKGRTLRAPFGITPWLYNFAMHWQVPVIFAAIYVLSVIALNAYNRSHGNKPWWIARQKFFKAFVVVHNIALALYSAATFFAMLRAITHTWPGFNNPDGLSGVADSLCKIHGPRGLGDAVTYNSTINIWESKNQLVHVSPLGVPIETDVGRLWNEGLAFWGWIFYLSKFYEVLDTFIIVAKGKRSPTLQTYHHAGAMLCMWAGIRYMSPPIWMFVFINSFIHALMYTYFTLTALDIRVSKSIKRTLTTMQIAQFVFGASYAAIHLFVEYDIPVATPYKVASTAAAVVSHVTSAVTSATSEISHVIETPTPTASLAAVIKKYLLRAAGEEGVAERVGIARNVNQPAAEAIRSQQHAIADRAQAPVEPQYETRWRTDYTTVNCIDTSGEAFAIYLNFLYLLPLTVLFVRFFYKAYVARVRRNSSISGAAKGVPKDAGKAKEDTEHAIEDAGESLEDKVARSAPEIQKEVKDLRDQLREDVKKMKDGTFRDRRVSERVQSFEGKVKDLADKAKDTADKAKDNAKSSIPRPSSPAKKRNDERNISADGRNGTEDESKPSNNRAQTTPKDDLRQQKASSGQSEDNKENQAPSSESEPTKATGNGDKSQPGAPANDAKLSSGADRGGKPSSDNSKPGVKTQDSSKAKDSNPASSKSNNDKSSNASKSTPSNGDALAQAKAEQDANIDGSQTVRPGVEDPSSSGDSKPSISSQDKKASDDKKSADKKPASGTDSNNDKGKNNPNSSPTKMGIKGKDERSKKDEAGASKPSSSDKLTAETMKVAARDQSEAEQDAALEATSATRPEPDSPDLSKSTSSSKDDSKPDDSDAMGQSGVDVDHLDTGNAEKNSEQPDMEADFSEKTFAEDAAQTMKPSGVVGTK